MANSFEQMQRFYRALGRFQEQERNRFRVMEQLANAARKAVQIDKSLAVAKALERFQQQEQSRLHVMGQLAEAATKAFRASYLPVQEAWSETIRQTFEELPEQMRKVMKYLFARGWYVGPDMTLPGTKYLARVVDRGEHAKIEAEMQEWAEGRIDDILVKVKKDFPGRRGIIGDAIEAHRNGKYSLSVPVLLAQADGIAHESLNTFLFRGNPPKQFEKFLNTLGAMGLESTLDILVSPLRSYSTLGKKAKTPLPGSEKGHANRHEVLHGMDTDYSTKANSLRALLLMDYLLGIKGMLDSHKEWAKKWRKELEEVFADAGNVSRPGETGPINGESQ